MNKKLLPLAALLLLSAGTAGMAVAAEVPAAGIAHHPSAVHTSHHRHHHYRHHHRHHHHAPHR